jgi:mannitol-specific phosphotransferase system IIBC component
VIGFVSGAGVGQSFQRRERGEEVLLSVGQFFPAGIALRICTTDCRGGSMRKLLGALTLATFLCVTGATYAQDAEKKQDDAKQDTTKKETKKKKSSKKKSDKKEEEKKDDSKKPS